MILRSHEEKRVQIDLIHLLRCYELASSSIYELVATYQSSSTPPPTPPGTTYLSWPVVSKAVKIGVPAGAL